MHHNNKTPITFVTLLSQIWTFPASLFLSTFRAVRCVGKQTNATREQESKRQAVNKKNRFIVVTLSRQTTRQFIRLPVFSDWIAWNLLIMWSLEVAVWDSAIKARCTRVWKTTNFGNFVTTRIFQVGGWGWHFFEYFVEGSEIKGV